MRQIPLTQGQVALVDDEDFGWLSEFNWCATWNPPTRSFYAVRYDPNPQRRLLRMHNAIYEDHRGPIPDGLTVDHSDRDTLNDRGSNLRLATRSQQMQNRRLFSTNTSGYRGVGWHKGHGTWQARIAVEGKRICLGGFTDPIEAARAYDAAARIHHDPAFVQLNFPRRSATE